MLLFPALASSSGFGAVISCAAVRSYIMFCNAVSANRNVVAASRFLGATAACVILFLCMTCQRGPYTRRIFHRLDFLRTTLPSCQDENIEPAVENMKTICFAAGPVHCRNQRVRITFEGISQRLL